MTILNVAWQPDRVLIGVDTIVSEASSQLRGTEGELTKMIYLAQGVVMASRGPAHLLAAVGGASMLQALGAPPHGCLDRLIATLPGSLAGFGRLSTMPPPTDARAARDVSRAGLMSHLEEFEVAVAGWSKARGRVHAIVFWQASAAEGLQRTDLAEDMPSWLTPWADPPEWPPEPEAPRTVDEMHDLAARQVEITRGLGDTRFGGRSVVAELRLGQAVFSERVL
jgi:hypothetical protein